MSTFCLVDLAFRVSLSRLVFNTKQLKLKLPFPIHIYQQNAVVRSEMSFHIHPHISKDLKRAINLYEKKEPLSLATQEFLVLISLSFPTCVDKLIRLLMCLLSSVWIMCMKVGLIVPLMHLILYSFGYFLNIF